ATMAWGIMLDRIGGARSDHLAFAVVFALAAAGGVADILIHLKVAEPAPVREPVTREFLRSVWERLSGPLLHPGFRKLALALGAWSFAGMMVGPFGNLYLKDKFGVSYSALALMSAVAALSTVVYCKGFGYLIDRLGARAVGGASMVLGPLFSVVAWLSVNGGVWHFNLPWLGAVAVPQCVAVISGISMLNAGFFACVGLAHMNLLADVVPQRGRTVAMAVQFAGIGALGALGAYAGGRLVDVVKGLAPGGFSLVLPSGMPLDYIHILILVFVVIIWGVALPLLLSVRLPRDKTKFREVVDQIILVNPFRFATGVYNARILSLPASRGSHLKAVEAVGNNATVVALADIVEKTRDPSVDIREAAVHSLGKIGNAEAIGVLAGIAAQPDSDIAVAALRALRACAGPEAANALVPLLSHLNIEVVREAARTLGATRNPAAVEPLSSLIHSTRNNAVGVAAAEALSRLGDLHAVYAIIPRMRGAAGETYHRTYATAAADLLGERDMFYKILSMDDSAHGSGLAVLIRRLHANIERAESLKAAPVREHIFVLIRNIDLHYEARELRPCAQNIFDLACALAVLRHDLHYRDDLRVFLATLEERDPHFAAGVWYTAVLSGALQRDDTSQSLAGIRTTTEALLGVFILASWSRQK
ncbi:MAG: HEAT repeat domain-containing protein, partial [Kiritimatiellaeota bacterium]|nr:HEAT repeat domain-containing protein [Kiritimatiellota bacterium]